MAREKNINFKIIGVDGEKKITRLKHRFDKKLFSADKYCKAYGLDTSMFSKLMDGRVTGAKSKPNGTTAKIISRLKADSIWIGSLPWKEN